jgi:microcystin-dependent protein
MGQNAFLGQLALVPYNFAPAGWEFAQGQILPLSQNTALFSLLGTFYGGDGRSTFALPNLEGNVVVSQGQGAGLANYIIGETGGTSTVTLLLSQLPAHTHTPQGVSQKADQADPHGLALANGENSSGGTLDLYASGTPSLAMNANALASAGGSQAHNNLMPYLALNWIIALQGVFPTRP